MNARRVEITLDQQTWDRLEAARLREPRASFVKRALESALARQFERVAPLTRECPIHGLETVEEHCSLEHPRFERGRA